MFICIIFIISIVIATIVVNALFMMSKKKQFISIVVISLFIASFIMRLFGIIPE